MADPGAARSEFATRNVVSGALFGVGLVAFLDEALFHQLLHWHHFYDRSTPNAGLVSDGLFHAVSWFATIAGLFMLADIRRNRAWQRGRWWGGALLGAGIFQLYDGIVQHKLLELHQIRYGVEITPYDVAWNVVALLLIVAGGNMLWRAGREPALAPPGRL
jgi:uncharacterized membrane protein